MPIRDTYKKRKAREAGITNDVYQYDEVPFPLRAQIKYILKRFLTVTNAKTNYYSAYYSLVEVLREEMGRVVLAQSRNVFASVEEELWAFFQQEEDCDEWLTGVDLSFQVAIENLKKLHGANGSAMLAAAQDEFNQRCIEHGFGYAIESGMVVRVDSQFVHHEVVKPALLILSAEMYEGARTYFLNAHEHYRHSKYEVCIVECGKAVEAVMKAICVKRGWSVPGNATFGDLVKVCFNNNIIDPIWRGHFDNLEKLLKSGIPPARNIKAAHASTTVTPIPQPIVSYVLHMTASTVVFLADAEKLLP